MKEAHLTDNAHRNHEILFPKYKSVLKHSDPELIEIFDNFAFDEILAQSSLDVKTRVLMILASTIGCQALSEYRLMVGGALNVGITPIEIKEVLYQSVPYVGMSKVFDFVHATNQVFAERDIAVSQEGQSTTTAETRREKGLAAQHTIFGSMIEQLYERSPKDLLHIQEFLSANCFGDFYTRSGLDLKTRELVTLSILIALGGVESQIKGHIQGNLNIGNDRSVLVDLITQLLPWVGYPRALNALNCLNEVVPEEKQV